MPEHDRLTATTTIAAEPPAEAIAAGRGGLAQMLLGLQRSAGATARSARCSAAGASSAHR